MSAVLIDDVETEVPPAPRWLVLVRGVLWLLVAMAVLSFTPTSVWAIGTMMAAVIIFGGIDELATAAEAPSWRWLHIVGGIVFVAVGAMALVSPFQTFGILALFIGWYLMFKGCLDIALAIGTNRPMWGLTLAVGIAQVLLAVWALGYPGRSAWLLVVWVGTGALFRGIGDLIAAVSHRGDLR